MKTADKKMKIWELSLLIGLLAALLWGMDSLRAQTELSDKVVRLHILANTDSEQDQALKLQVRDAILDRTEAILRDSENREDAEKHLRAALPTLTRLAQETVDAQGYGYNVTAELKTEAFPTRTYENQGGASENFTLPAGEYLALRIVIGKGEGRNWWCVVFPPLCAQTTTDVAQTAMAAGLGEDDVKLLTESEGGYVLKFKSVELWERLREKWSE